MNLEQLTRGQGGLLLAIAATIAFAYSTLLPCSPAHASSETGGSGLFRVEQAYSMPVGRPLISFYGGYFTSDGAPGNAHLFTLVPSATWGLGGGFEGALALPLEGKTSDLDSLDYERRIDLRKRDLVAKFRWTAPLGASDSRLGVQAMLGLPLGDSTRPGGDRTPSLNLDPGISILYSTNFGGLRYPLRMHANVGYWWSRDDGAFYFRNFPDAVPIEQEGSSANDVLMAGIGIEVGFRRFVGIAELETQQFTQSRSQLDSSENLWVLTVGLRSAISSTIGMTSGIAFDLSSDDPSTTFDPGNFYPGTEFRLGFTFGSVLSREEYEARRAARQERERQDEPASSTPRQTLPSATVGDTGRGTEVGASDEAGAIRQLEARIAQLELLTRLSAIETRLRLLELGGNPGTTSRTPAASIEQQVDALQRQLLLLQEAGRGEAPATAPERSEPPPAPFESSSAPESTEKAPSAATTQATDVTSSSGVLASRPRTPPTSRETRPSERTVPAPRGSVHITTEVGSSAPVNPAPSVALVVPTERATLPADSTESLPAATVSPPSGGARPSEQARSVVEQTPVPNGQIEFRLPVGARATLDPVELGGPTPLTDTRAREALGELATDLRMRPDVRLLLLVHGGNGDRAGALERTFQQASMLRDYLVVAGAQPDQIVPLGLGVAETGDASRSWVEIERIQ